MNLRVEQLVGRLVVANNDRIRRVEGDVPAVRDLSGVQWHHTLVAHLPQLRAEWDAFEAAGGRLPLIEELLQESQGNEGPWRVGLLVARGRPAGPLVERFPATLAALHGVPALRSALWSVLDAGTQLPRHEGPNAGVLRYHLGVSCPPGDVGLEVDGVTVPLAEGAGVLFDDTRPHSSWNRADRRRVTLFVEVLRPLGPLAGGANRAIQAVLSLDHRYREAPRRATEWQRRNHDATGRDGAALR